MWPSSSSSMSINNNCSSSSSSSSSRCITFCKNSDFSIISFDGHALGSHLPICEYNDDDDDDDDDSDNLSCDDNSITTVSVIGLILIRHRNSEQ